MKSETTELKSYFNPRSHGGSDIPRVYVARYRMNFNPRSHGGSDTMELMYAMFEDISIHAPTGGATRETYSRCGTGGFQSTLPRGERHTSIPVPTALNRISIHAPTGGATIHSNKYWIHEMFQSTLPRGERQQKSPNLNSNFCKVVTKIHCFLLFEKLISI